MTPVPTPSGHAHYFGTDHIIAAQARCQRCLKTVSELIEEQARELTQAVERIDQLERLLQEWVDDFSCECKNSTCTMCKSRAALGEP